MVPIMNVPFLARTLERLYDAGIRDVILPAGYMPQAITEYFGDGSDFGMKITYVIEDEPLGTAGAIKNVEQYIHGPFFVLNGDVLTSLDLQAMMEYHKAKGGLRSEEHTSELQSRGHLVCRLLLEKKNNLSLYLCLTIKKKIRTINT